MKCYDFDWQINEFMIYCRSTQLRDRTMYSYIKRTPLAKSSWKYTRHLKKSVAWCGTLFFCLARRGSHTKKLKQTRSWCIIGKKGGSLWRKNVSTRWISSGFICAL